MIYLQFTIGNNDIMYIIYYKLYIHILGSLYFNILILFSLVSTVIFWIKYYYY